MLLFRLKIVLNPQKCRTFTHLLHTYNGRLLSSFKIGSKLIWLLLLIGTLASMGNVQRYKDGVIRWDIVWYYSYLPAYFIHHDIKLGFVDNEQQRVSRKLQPASATKQH